MSTLRTTLRAQVVIGLITAVAALIIALMPASSATAAPSANTAPSAAKARNYFGAIAVAADQAAGYSYDYRTKARAKARALRGCKARSNYASTCRVVGWMRNACGAASIKVNSNGFVTRVGYGWGRNQFVAKRKARASIGGGRIVTWVCTTRYR